MWFFLLSTIILCRFCQDHIDVLRNIVCLFLEVEGERVIRN